MEQALTAKLALGTVQFGLDYGINNTRGRVPEKEVGAILDAAAEAGLRRLDTSSAYGCAEEVLGRVLAGRSATFEIVSKLARGPVDEVLSQVERTFRRLGVNRLYGYLCHHFDFYLAHPAVWECLRRLKAEGRVERIGFSLYAPSELALLLEREAAPDLIQVPYNVLDRRFETLLTECSRRGIAVQVRSVFLQGLLLRRPEELPPYFDALRKRIAAIHDTAAVARVTPAQLLLIWTAFHPGVSEAVIGVDSLAELRANLGAAAAVNRVRPHLAALNELQESDERLILPTHWPK